MVGVLMGNEDGMQRSGIYPYLSEPKLSLLAGEATVHEETLPRRFDEGTVCFTTGREN
jgi:hypothetical protein